MTLKEIAELANVSVSTVSRVLNGKTAGTNKESYARIWEIVKRENYIPNKSAQCLRTGDAPLRETPKTISCLLARTSTATDDPFFSQLARSIDAQAYKENYIVKHLYTEQDFLFAENLRTISDEQSHGIIIMGRCNPAVLKILKSNFRFVGYTGLNYLDAKYDQTICDGMRASEAAVDHLLALGHRTIGYIGETKNEIRYQGYCNALAKAGIAVDERLIANVTVSLDGGYSGAKQLLSRKSNLTAIFCANDMTALGTIRAIRNEKKRVPKDISVIGIDDIPMASYSSPALTTVHIPIDELGQFSVRVLADRIKGLHELPIRIDLPFFLIERDSCAPPQAK